MHVVKFQHVHIRTNRSVQILAAMNPLCGYSEKWHLRQFKRKCHAKIYFVRTQYIRGEVQPQVKSGLVRIRCLVPIPMIVREMAFIHNAEMI